MDRVLTQALKIPGQNGQVELNYPASFASFKFATLGDVLGKAMPYVFAFAGIGLLLMIISAGFTLLTSAGDAKKLETGKTRLTWAIVGFLIVFTAYWATQLAGIILGVAEFKNIFPW